MPRSQTQLTLDDLEYLYVLVDVAPDRDRELLTVPQMTDQQFREWAVGFAAHHGAQILPTLGRLGLETRLAIVNRMIRMNVPIYLAPRNPEQA